MSESVGVSVVIRGLPMPIACSADIRKRVIASVRGGASRREAAEQFEVSASAAVKWLHCWQVTGQSVAKARGGSTSALEEHKDWLLCVIGEQPDLTLDEVVAAMRKEGIAGSRSAVGRFFARHKMSFKKKPARGGAGAGGRRPDASALASRARQT
jgi:transposase